MKSETSKAEQVHNRDARILFEKAQNTKKQRRTVIHTKRTLLPSATIFHKQAGTELSQVLGSYPLANVLLSLIMAVYQTTLHSFPVAVFSYHVLLLTMVVPRQTKAEQIQLGCVLCLSW